MRSFLLPLILASLVTTGGFALEQEHPPILKAANRWKVGKLIPKDLLVYREFDGCLAVDTDTVPLFNDITNYPLLRQITVTKCDERVFACVINRAMLLVGPSRFFGDVLQFYTRQPELLSQPRHRSLKARSQIKHVVVDGLFIADKDTSAIEAQRVFGQVTRDLQTGMSFDSVRRKYQEAHEYSYMEALSDGKKVKLTRTRVGNYGDYVISKQSHTARPLRFADMPAEHVAQLLKREPGDVIVRRDEGQKQKILYRVREVYTPET
jgi:hypothetical protein